jgi:hypothetical protein
VRLPAPGGQDEARPSDGGGSARSCAQPVAEGGIDCRGQMPHPVSSRARHMQCPPGSDCVESHPRGLPDHRPSGSLIRSESQMTQRDRGRAWSHRLEDTPRPPAPRAANRMALVPTRCRSPEPMAGAARNPCHGRVPHRTWRLHHRWGRRTPRRRVDRPTASMSSALGLPVPESNAWDQEMSGVEDRAGWTDPPSGHNLRGAWTMALHEHHARHEDHDTGSTHPSSHRRSRALRSTTGSTRSCSGCPPRCSIALETGGPPDELIEGAQ